MDSNYCMIEFPGNEEIEKIKALFSSWWNNMDVEVKLTETHMMINKLNQYILVLTMIREQEFGKQSPLFLEAIDKRIAAITEAIIIAECIIKLEVLAAKNNI